MSGKWWVVIRHCLAEDAPQIKDWGSCHEVTEGADCVAVGGNPVSFLFLFQ